jgi:predicted CXXCH cytochrome family protein
MTKNTERFITRLIVWFAVGLVVGLFAGSMHRVVNGDIVGTSHDFSNSSWGGGEICKPCHTPHMANPDVGYLWAHTLSDQTYTLYDGSVGLLDDSSVLCMSCHDGTVALNDYHPGGGPPLYIGEWFRIGEGGDLTTDHPVGDAAVYPVLGSDELHPAPVLPLVDGMVSCATCHTPHGRNGIDNLLRMDNAGSALCLECHIK